MQQYQGDDRIGAHLCTIRALVRSNRSGGPGRITPVGGKRVNLKLQRKGNSNSFEINSAHC